MQVQWNLVIAGAVVVACLALVVVALAWGKPREAAPEPARPASIATLPPPVPAPSLDATDPWASFAPPPAATAPPSLASAEPASAYSDFAADPFAAPPPATAAPQEAAPAPAMPAPLAATATTATAGGTTHTVAKGETLGDISAQHYGSARHWRRIVEANPGLDPARLKVGQQLVIPPLPQAAAAPAAAAAGDATYTVKPGDSYYTIARKVLGNPGRWRELEQLNGIPAEELRAGQVIKLPAKEGGTPAAAMAAARGRQRTHTVASGETLGDIAQRYYGTRSKWKLIAEANPGIRPESLAVGQQLVIPEAPAAAPAPASARASGGSRTYIVKPGDTLASIAASQLGHREAWKRIVEANPGIRPEALRVGQELIIPDAATAPTATRAAAPQAAAPAAAPAPAPAAAPEFGFADDPFFSPYEPLPAR